MLEEDGAPAPTRTRGSSAGLKYAFVTLAALVTLLSACSEDRPVDTRKAEPTTTVAQPASSPTLPQAVPDGRSPGALLVHWQEWNVDLGGWGAKAWPLSAGTATETPGAEPIELAYAPSSSVSPDGRLLAVTARGTDEVKVYDLTAWKLIASARAAPGLQPDSWSADGSQIFAWRDYCPRPASEGRCFAAWERDLWQIDIGQQSARRVASFDFSVMAMHLAAASDGRAARAYLLALRSDICCGVEPRGDPFMAVVDLARGEVSKEIPLPGLLAGQPRHWLGDTSIYASYWPASALAPDGSRLYVVDSVDHKVTVVNLRTEKIESTVDLKEPRSRSARIAGWLWSQLVGTAEAKGGPAYYRRAEVTPDGRYLLISGMVSIEDPRSGQARVWKDRPSGLLVVDTRKMSVVFREPKAAWFRLGPDGRRALAYGSYYDEDLRKEPGSTGLVGLGLKLIDLESLKVIAEQWPNEEVNVGSVSADSRYAYITLEGPGLTKARREGAQCKGDCLLLAVMDLEDGQVVSQRLLDWNYGILTVAPGRAR